MPEYAGGVHRHLGRSELDRHSGGERVSDGKLWVVLVAGPAGVFQISGANLPSNPGPGCMVFLSPIEADPAGVPAGRIGDDSQFTFLCDSVLGSGAANDRPGDELPGARAFS